ncbi:DHH family phosphoesterase [Candidatus Woesearchaeota archaeon]|nr:DHH family phosphoesterase [Candidatus Woesearchaeota archaeon]
MFVVDVAVVEQEFIDKAKVPVVWIDHHEPLKRNNALYFNPRVKTKNAYFPATYICYMTVKKDLWIAMVGCVGDWFLPEFSDEFAEQYPDLLDKGIKNPDDALFKSRLGVLVRLFSFVLKGRTSDALKCVRILTRVKSPYDILMQRTPEGKFLYRRYEKFNAEYQKLLSSALSGIGKDKLFVFTYGNQTSFSSDLANDILYRYPDKFIIIGREKDEEVRMSLRARDVMVLPKLKKALEGVDGYGGGHEYACGANVKKKDFARFVENLKKQL